MTDDLTIRRKILFCCKMYAFNLLGAIILAIIGVFIFGEISNHKTVSLDKQMITAFSALILSPILEELIFRLVLNDFSKIKSVFFASFSFFVAMFFSYYKNDGLDFRYFIVLFWIIIIWSCYFISKNIAPSKFKKFETTLIVVSSVLFSISHFQNYEIRNGDYSFVITFFALFLSGILLAKVRMKIGIVWSMFTHFLFNLIPTLSLFFEHFNK